MTLVYRMGVLFSLTTAASGGELVTLPKRLNPTQEKGGQSPSSVQNHPPPHQIRWPRHTGCARATPSSQHALAPSENPTAWVQIPLSLEGSKLATPMPTNRPFTASQEHRALRRLPRKDTICWGVGTLYYLPLDPLQTLGNPGWE